MTPDAEKWACITGATSGIGEAFAREFAKNKYHLILTGRRISKLEALSETLQQKYNIQAEIETGNLSERNAAEELAGRLRRRKNIRILVNNAGFGVHSDFHREDFSVHEDMISVHELAALRLAHAVLPQMITAGEGMIINVSSTAAFTPHPLNAVYAATKCMLKLFSESLFLELQGTGVYVQALCPGITRTEFHERMGLDKDKIYGKKGLLKAMDPEEVVKISLKYARKGKAVCVPGFNNKAVRWAVRYMPKSLIYAVIKKKLTPRSRN